MPIPTSYPKPGEVFIPGNPTNGGRETYPNAPKPEEAVHSVFGEPPESEESVETPVSPRTAVDPSLKIVDQTDVLEKDDKISDPQGITGTADEEERKFIDGIQGKEEITGLV